MESLELVLLFLLAAVAALTGLARLLGVPYPILLVVGGSLLGFVPGVPDVELAPDLVLLIFLPPLLFNAAYFASLRDLRQNLRPITLSAVGLVLVTMAAVALVVHAAVPTLPWAVAFAFGAVVSPTDPLAAITIARRLGVPRNLVAVVEGESLVNDGTALVAYRTAVAAAVGGGFDLLSASGEFVLNVAGGIAVGLVAAEVMTWVFRHVDDDVLGVTISLLAGYAGYLPAEELHVSGVIAAVTVGLVVGHRAHELSSAGSRLRGYAFWDVLVFLLNAVLFVLVGLQLPGILASQERSAGELLGLGALAGGVVVATRLVWLNTMPYLIRALDRRPAQRLRRVGWRPRLVVAWSGLRGAVSLAAALALPPAIPERDLLIFLTLCVIFATLVLQGLTLPLLIRAFGIRDDGAGEREELHARKAATEAALGRLRDLRDEPWTRDETIDRMIGAYEFRRRRLAQRAGLREDGDEDLEARSHAYQRAVREVLDTQRRTLVRLRDEGAISDEVLHALQRELDLEDQRLEV
jgi:CPA1 family monovalent cation:H+ antiporter